MSSDISTRRIVVQSVVGIGITVALLFGGAGTIAWPEAWLFLLIQISSSIVMVSWLKKHNPELLQERMDLWKRLVKPWDKIIVVLLIAAMVPLFALPGFDAVRYQWSDVPLSLKVMGFAGILVSYGLIFWVVKTNPYSSAVVEIQEERGHKTITTGPYQFVRHPMYVGAILWFLSTPLALGSLVTFIPGIILTALIVLRTYLEDKTLHQQLEGYAAYAQTVKCRLIPGIW
jgi:protein-S-isoprenylcysteine O-methyltransferase Ste14